MHGDGYFSLEAIQPRLDIPLLFPARGGGHIGRDNWRIREWYPALDAAGIARRGPYHLRHTFATEALAAGVSIFQLARRMGTSVKMIDAPTGTWCMTARTICATCSRAYHASHDTTGGTMSTTKTWADRPEMGQDP